MTSDQKIRLAGAILKGVIYCLLAALTSLREQLLEGKPLDLVAWLGVAVAVLLVLRAFVDGSAHSVPTNDPKPPQPVTIEQGKNNPVPVDTTPDEPAGNRSDAPERTLEMSAPPT